MGLSRAEKAGTAPGGGPYGSLLLVFVAAALSQPLVFTYFFVVQKYCICFPRQGLRPSPKAFLLVYLKKVSRGKVQVQVPVSY